MLHNDEGPGAVIYLGIHDGRISRAASENAEGATPYVLKDGRTLYKFFFRAVSGWIVAIRDGEKRLKDKSWTSLEIEMRGERGESYLLEMNMESDYARTFLQRAENIDYSDKVMLMPYCFKDETEKERKGITIKQDGIKIERAYDNDTVPGWVKTEVEGKTIWDKSEEINWYKARLASHIRPKMEQESEQAFPTRTAQRPTTPPATVPQPAPAAPKPQPASFMDEGGEIDDLPF